MNSNTTLTVSDIRVHDNRKIVVIYFVSECGLYVLRVRGDGIHNLPYTLSNVAVLFYNNICLMNDGVTVKRCFPLLKGVIDLSVLSGIMKHSAEILPHEFIRDLPVEEGARGIYMLLKFNPKVVIIFKINCNNRIYLDSLSDVSYSLRSLTSTYGAIENIVFDRGDVTVRK